MIINKLWANAYWIFFHGTASNLNKIKLTKEYLNNYKTFIRSLILSIPCKNCRSDTLSYFERNNFSSITNKEELISFFYLFHNYVNVKLNKKRQGINILEKYKNINIIHQLQIIDKEIFKFTINKHVYSFFLYITS